MPTTTGRHLPAIQCKLFALTVMLLTACFSHGQGGPDSLLARLNPDKLIPAEAPINLDTISDKLDPIKFSLSVEKKAKSLEEKINSKTEKTLRKLQQQEEKIFKSMLKGKDSLLAKIKLGEITKTYAALKSRLNASNPNKTFQHYIPKLDSLSTALKFLNQAGKVSILNSSVAKLGTLQLKFDQAEEVRQFNVQRKAQLNQFFRSLGAIKKLKAFNKEVYYYSAQVREYKEILGDSKKMERKALELLGKTKVFQDFLKKNGTLASIFPMPGGSGTSTSQSGFAGLQTRVQMTSFLQQTNLINPTNLSRVRQSIQDAQSQVTALRNAAAKYGEGVGDDFDMPDFKPNSQKTKSFLKRLEFGSTFQSQKASYFLPVTSDIGLSVGYKLNDKSVIGIGASYKIGFGKSWSNIKLTSEGMGLRSYVDWKLKGSLWVSGGFEQHYRTAFNTIEELKELDNWQQSGLLGISKVISIKSKFLKKTKVQMLWDFLSYQQIPKTQPILFRFGYTF